MQVQTIMTTNPACVTPDTPLRDAARLMQERNVGLLPVVERDGGNVLVGVVTDRDITLRHVAAGHNHDGCLVREAMTDHVTTCRQDADVNEAMMLMGRERVRRIPIVNERGSLVGVVAQADIVRRADDAMAAEHTIEQISAPS